MKGRQRGRSNNGGKPRMHHQGGGGGGRTPNFDHNAGRMRGNAQQLMDKFLALARDASAQGDRVLAENYFQHADHYYRVVNARFEGQPNQQNQQQRRFNGPGQDRGYDSQDGQDGQGNYQDYNNGSEMAPGPSQNLIQPAPAGDSSQSHMQGQPQPVYDQQPYQPQPQQQRQPQQPQQQQARDDGDIGLPPQLFGNADAPQRVDSEPGNNGETPAPAGSERNSRPRHAGRRRFSSRQGQPRPQPEPVDAT